jgi:transposase-like protein
MALICGACKSDHTQTGVGRRGKCLSCGSWFDARTREPIVGSFEWTSEVPDKVREFAQATVDAA